MNEEQQMIDQARYRDFQRAADLGAYTPVEQILGKMSDQYALFAACAAIVDAVAAQRGVHCDCPTVHRLNCPVAEAIDLVRRMSSL